MSYRSGIKGAIPIDRMASEIAKALNEWSQDVADATKKAVVETTAEAVLELKRNSPRDSGAYARDWDRKTLETSRYGIRNVVYNKKHYRLTHLLEHGHANARGGGRTPAYPHIGIAEARAMEMLQEKTERYIHDVD